MRLFDSHSFRMLPNLILKKKETYTTASTDPHRTHRNISNAYYYVLRTSYGMRTMRTILGSHSVPKAGNVGKDLECSLWRHVKRLRRIRLPVTPSDCEIFLGLT
uniref:SFRICE_026651 n=1 Tax=Spodoptera frugiperda TaxID=7108 RepID=A0A2H1WRD8_SPOFR